MSKTHDGIARVSLPSEPNEPGHLLVAKKDKDVAFAHQSENDWDYFIYRHRGAAVRWFVFDDRGTYKPGEEVHMKGWVRDAMLERGGDLAAIAGVAHMKLHFAISDSRGATLGNGEAVIDNQGSFDFAFTLPGNANLGRASVMMQLGEGKLSDVPSHQHSFKVEEFRKPEFEVAASAIEGPHFVGEHAIATLTASYYSGGGLPSAHVTWSAKRKITSFSPPNQDDYHFGPDEPRSWYSTPGTENNVKTESWSAVTDSHGTHRLRLDFDALQPSYPIYIGLTGEVTDVNRQRLVGHTSMFVHPASAYVGVRLEKNFARVGEDVDVSLIAADIDGKALFGRPMAVRMARLDAVQHGKEVEEKEVELQTCNVTSRAAGEPVHCTIKPTQGGPWRVTAIVTDAEGRKNQTVITLWVTGSNMVLSGPNTAANGVVIDDELMGDELTDEELAARTIRDEVTDDEVTGYRARAIRDEVTVIANKYAYKPGETAELLVIAPFTPAEGVLTVRRQGIVHIERFTMHALAHVLKVKLSESWVPNVEMHVDLVGATVRENATGKLDEHLPKRPAHASGKIDARVLPVSRTLAVKVTPQTQVAAPGSTTAIDVEVKDASDHAVNGAQVALWVVDESVLVLSHYKTPDPIRAFYAPRSIDVQDFGMRDRVVLTDPHLEDRGQLSAQPPWGCGVDCGFAHSFGHGYGMLGSIPVRTNFSPLALFAPRVRTDAAGKATVPFKLPDNLTRYRVMAVASAGERNFGANESTITARLPLMVRPSAPRFLNFGDRFELPIIVQNHTDAPVDVGVVVRASNATIEEPSAKRMTIAAGDRVEVRFASKTVKPGMARFQIGVASKNLSDASEIELPVYTPATTEAFATYGEIDNGAIAQPVKMPAGVFPQFGGLEISTSSTALSALTDAFLYLIKYKFECNEQVASRVLAVAGLRDVLMAFKAESMPSPEDLAASMKEDLDRLKRFQKDSGGWGFWGFLSEKPSPYVSVHVTHALVRAKEKGYEPDSGMMNSARGYLRAIESHIPGWYSADVRRTLVAYSLYVRKRMGDADLARAKKLIVEAGGVDKLPIEAVGWIWPTISDDKSAAAENSAIRVHVQNRAIETAGAAHFVSDYQDLGWVSLHSDRRVDGILLESLIGDQPSSSLIPKLVKGLLDHRKAGRWTNTQENAFILLALDRYFRTYEKVMPDFVARVWLGDRFAGEHAFRGRTTESSNIDVPMPWLVDCGAFGAGRPACGETSGEAKATQNLTLDKSGPGRLYYRIGMQYAPTNLKLAPADHGFAVSRVYEGAEKPGDVIRDADGTWHVKAGAKVRVRVSMVAPSRRFHVALVDPLPAGLEVLNPALATTGEIPKDPKEIEDAAKSGGRYWYWNRTWYEHQNMRDERVEAFASLLWEGVWNYTYVAVATIPGVFVVPPPKAEEMYAPETFGRGSTDKMIIQ
ncbi:MAG: MG2 domain-containing protein [Polyangiaceae bacterium]|nr:MG2 domain-containing protein [Polyangiaceae bacterium]